MIDRILDIVLKSCSSFAERERAKRVKGRGDEED